MLGLTLLLLMMSSPALAAPPGGDLVVVSCPGGAVAIARNAEDVHCAGALRMPPGRVARVRSADDRGVARAYERDLVRESDLEAELDARERAYPDPVPAPAPLRVSRLAYAELLRSAREVDAPFTLTLQAKGATESLRIVHSPGIERALGSRLETQRRILLFAREGGTPRALESLVFTQAGKRFRPSVTKPAEFGWIERTHPVPDSRSLGYVVLPESFDVGRPLTIFWKDEVHSARIQPGR